MTIPAFPLWICTTATWREASWSNIRWQRSRSSIGRIEKDKIHVDILFDDALHNMAVEYHTAGHPEYFAVCEMVHHKVMRPIEKKYAEEEG